MKTITLRKQYDEEGVAYYTIFIGDTYVNDTLTFNFDEAVKLYNALVSVEKNLTEVEILKSTDI